MHDYPGHTSLYVTVQFADGEVTCSPNPLEIPANTVATITWVPATGNAFTFLRFEWCNQNGFLSQDPIIHDQCVIAAVNNTHPDAIGEWPYILKIQVGDRVYQQGTIEDMGDGKPKIHNR